MSLSEEDVQDILALLDGLPYGELTLQTARFTLTLRRAGDGVWAQETRVTAEPVLADPTPASPAPARPATADPGADPAPSGPAADSGADPTPSGAAADSGAADPRADPAPSGPAADSGADPAPSGPTAADPAPSGPAVHAHDGTRESTSAQGQPRAADGTPAPGAGPGSEIRAQLPGTFYRAPQPGAPPYVETGSRVEADTVVAIIETMKLMNPVYAGAVGTVAEICLADGQFAEQGTVLMRISAGG